jgi:transposase InsO family protein
VKPRQYRRCRFPVLYTRTDAQLLAQVDEANDGLSGQATQKLLQRACYEFGDMGYQRLARLSVAHLYRLRKSPAYRKERLIYQPTRPVQVPIGERRAPRPQGRAGFLRVDTVHQGDRDGVKGVYYINAVDEVTQWQVIGAVPQISEGALLPVLEQMLRQLPFHIRGFHSDNGSEYINYSLSDLLKRLLIDQTKSRPRHCNDNALAEAKNGAVVRKHMGYGHIAASQAPAIGKFMDEHLNPYLNFHRPCAVPEQVIVNEKGKVKTKYRWFATPWEILRQLPDLARQLKTDVTIADLEQQARAKTDMQAAQQMTQAKNKLYSGPRNLDQAIS